MRRIRSRSRWLRVATAVVFLTGSAASADTFKIQAERSRVRFEVGHHGYAKPVRGRFAALEGRIEYDSAAPGELEIEVRIDADSLDTDNRFRDAHLRSSFFETDRFPTIEFSATRVSVEEMRIEGNLTMKGVSRALVLELSGARELTGAEGLRELRCRAAARLDRREFGVAENADRAEGLEKILAHIQEGLDEFIDDEVEISIFVVARERAPVVATSQPDADE